MQLVGFPPFFDNFCDFLFALIPFWKGEGDKNIENTAALESVSIPF